MLIVIRSPYRRFFERFLEWLRELTAIRPDRPTKAHAHRWAAATGPGWAPALQY
jgi:hypothetical protein